MKSRSHPKKRGGEKRFGQGFLESLTADNFYDDNPCSMYELSGEEPSMMCEEGKDAKCEGTEGRRCKVGSGRRRNAKRVVCSCVVLVLMSVLEEREEGEERAGAEGRRQSTRRKRRGVQARHHRERQRACAGIIERISYPLHAGEESAEPREARTHLLPSFFPAPALLP